MIFDAIKNLFGTNPIPQEVYDAMPEPLKKKVDEARQRKAELECLRGMPGKSPIQICITWHWAPLAGRKEIFDAKTGERIATVVS
jgi:hypothetical protein